MKNKSIYLLIILLIGLSTLSSQRSAVSKETVSRLADSHSTAIQFVDVTEEAGIDFRHINGAEGAYHLPETLGAGGAFFDADNDGDLDLYLVSSGYWKDSSSTNEALSALYRNNGDSTFTDITTTAGVG